MGFCLVRRELLVGALMMTIFDLWYRVSAFVFTAPLREMRAPLTSLGLFRAGPARFTSSSFQPQGRCWQLANGSGAWSLPEAMTRTTSRGGRRLYMAQESLILTEENVVMVLAEAKQELSTLFGNSAENSAVGITGDVEFVGLEGPTAVVRLTGRFWHEKSTVLSRVANYVMTRIPECVDVEVEDPAQLEDSDPPQPRSEAAEI
ncbi:unnamed protein product [Ascophyllum nodosum]